jgi:esterase
VTSADSPSASGPLSASRIGAVTAGRSVILLHGFLGSGRNLRTLGLRLGERMPDTQFLLPDLRGHGQSPGLRDLADPSAISLADLGGDVLATAAANGFVPPYHFVGHSLGGRVALGAAGQAPEQIASVTLLDIGPGQIDPARSDSRPVLDALLAAPADAPDRRAMRAILVAGGLSPALTDWLLMNLVIEDKRVHWAIDRQALDALHGQSMREDLWGVVNAAGFPIRCIRGGRSRYVSDSEATRLAAAGCPVEVLPEAGHFVHVDALDPLVELLVRDLG